MTFGGGPLVSTCRSGRHDDHDVYRADCPCRALLDLLASKWAALIIGLLADRGPVRFTEMASALPGVGPKMLTKTLRRLEAASLIDREVFAEVPARVEYTLTALGASVSEPLGLVRAWAEEHVDEIETLNPQWRS